MRTKQTIAVIGGLGSVGAGFCKRLALAKYRLLLFSESSSDVEELIANIRKEVPDADMEAVPCTTDACWEADIIVVGVLASCASDLAKKIGPMANQKVVVSMSFLRDGVHYVPESNAAEDLQQRLQYAKVVRVAYVPAGDGTHGAACSANATEVMLSGIDDEAVHSAAHLMHAAGFNPVLADMHQSR